MDNPTAAEKRAAKRWVREHFATYVENADMADDDYPPGVQEVWSSESERIAAHLRGRMRDKEARLRRVLDGFVDSARHLVKEHGLKEMKPGGIPFTSCQCSVCRRLRELVNSAEGIK